MSFEKLTSFFITQSKNMEGFNCECLKLDCIVNNPGGVTEAACPYKCISDRYHMPHCYTTLEELIYTFGGPWWFVLILVGLLILLALVLSVARMRFVGVDDLPGPAPTQHGSQIDHSFPFLESLNEVHNSLLFLFFFFVGMTNCWTRGEYVV